LPGAAFAAAMSSATDLIVGDLLVQHGVQCNGARAHEQRVAVGRGARGGFDADDIAGAGLVLDEKLLAQGVGEVLREHARDDVGAA